MKKFKVLSCGFGEICGGEQALPIEDAVALIRAYKGWDSLDRLQQSIRMWASRSRAGDVYKTQSSAIVAVGSKR